MCRSCGAIVAAGEKVCPQCGNNLATSAATAAAGQAPQGERTSIYQTASDSEAMRFARAVLTRPAPFTIAFLVANVFLSLLTAMSGGTDNTATLLAYGGQMNERIDAGDWWRFITPMFLHGGVAHLLMNMYGLWMLGQYVERLYGSAKFVFFWVACGVAGSVASYLALQPSAPGGVLGQFLFHTQDRVSVGASGALFGIVGVLLVFGIKYRRELPQGFRQAFGAGLLPIILINVFIGYVGRGAIDNAAHMGGLAAGALLALVIGYKRPDERDSVAFFWHAVQIAAIALVLFGFFKVWQNYNGVMPSISNITSPTASPNLAANNEAATHLDALKEASIAFDLAFNERDVSKIDPALEKLNRAPGLDDRTTALRDRMKTLLERIKKFAGDAPNKDRPLNRAQSAELNVLLKDSDEWHKDWFVWVDENGARHGITRTAPDQEQKNGAQK